MKAVIGGERCQSRSADYRIRLVGAVLLAAASHVLVAEEMEQWQPKHAFSADIVEFNKHINQVHQESRLVLGKTGFRMESPGIPGQTPPIVYLQNFTAKKAWMLTPAAEHYVELQEDAGSENISGGLMSTRPCMEQTANPLGKRNWQGLEITVWQCLEGNRPVGEQYFSAELGMVIRDEQEDGQVKEMRNIQRLAPEVEKFSPPKDYKNVSLREFFTGVPGLPVYED